MNALLHTPAGGGVQIAVKRETAAGDVPPAGILFSVSDDGAGIAKEDQERIFQKFVQGRRPSAKGSGLGLAFCRMAVELHGGKIWVESELKKGSTFFFTIPVSPPSPVPTSRSTTPSVPNPPETSASVSPPKSKRERKSTSLSAT